MDTAQSISSHPLAGIEVRDLPGELPVHEQMNRLADTLARTEALVSHVEDRLTPICGPNALAKDHTGTPEEVLSPVANNIRSARQTAERINDRIDNLLSALEL